MKEDEPRGGENGKSTFAKILLQLQNCTTEVDKSVSTPVI